MRLIIAFLFLQFLLKTLIYTYLKNKDFPSTSSFPQIPATAFAGHQAPQVAATVPTGCPQESGHY